VKLDRCLCLKQNHDTDITYAARGATACCATASLDTQIYGLLVAWLKDPWVPRIHNYCDGTTESGLVMALRVLMIDDSVFVRDVLRHHLECIGCEVVAEAENTVQALDLFRTVSPDLVTLDVAVPQIGGIGALALFRIMRHESPDTPVLVISGLAFPEVRKSFLREGALDYVSKPFTARSFESVRNRLMETFPTLGELPVRSVPPSVSNRMISG
jgi:two-component system, chemotaxis family, chemotaxis protein CheY